MYSAQTTDDAPATERAVRLQRLKWAFRCLLAFLALVDCWFARFQNTNDGVSIMDVGDWYFSRNWHAALNAYWSPVYGLLMAWMSHALKPSIQWDYPVVHLLNFLLFLGTLACFEYLWRGLLELRGGYAEDAANALQVWTLGYLSFAGLYLGSRIMEQVNPDLLVSALVLLALGMVARFAARRMSFASGAALGVVLGIGYLTKTAMLAFGVLIVATLFAVAWRHRRGFAFPVASLALFALISIPFAAALSRNNHHLTTGDSGTLNLAWNVNGINGSAYEYRLWQHDAGTSAHRLHPPHKLLNWPEVYEFATPVGGTYPIWTDPSYWWAGVDSRLRPVREVAALLHNTARISNYLVRDIGTMSAILLMLFLLSDTLGEAWSNLRRQWPVWLPALAVVWMFAMVIWMWRYTVGCNLALACTVLLSSSIAHPGRRAAILRATAATLAVAVGLMTFQSMFQNFSDRGLWANWVHIAEDVRAQGVAPAQRVAIIGDGFDEELWARLDHVQIVAEVPHTQATGDSATAFWNSSPETQRTVLNSLESSGAVAVIGQLTAGPAPPGWTPLGQTGHAIYFFPPQPSHGSPKTNPQTGAYSAQ